MELLQEWTCSFVGNSSGCVQCPGPPGVRHRAENGQGRVPSPRGPNQLQNSPEWLPSWDLDRDSWVFLGLLVYQKGAKLKELMDLLHLAMICSWPAGHQTFLHWHSESQRTHKKYLKITASKGMLEQRPYCSPAHQDICHQASAAFLSFLKSSPDVLSALRTQPARRLNDPSSSSSIICPCRKPHHISPPQTPNCAFDIFLSPPIPSVTLQSCEVEDGNAHKPAVRSVAVSPRGL